MIFLTDYNFITHVEETYPYQLTEKGIMATNIQEVNGMVFADLLVDLRLDTLTSSELAALFSCFANVSIPKDQRLQLQSISVSARMKQVLNMVQDYYNEIQDIELRYNIDSNEEYDIKYELISFILYWCSTDDEEQCKLILQRARSEGISIGEFTKAILKINNVASEFEKVCMIQGNIALLEKIKKNSIDNTQIYRDQPVTLFVIISYSVLFIEGKDVK